MIDIMRGIHSLCVAGFGMGNFTYINKHIHFNMLHENVTGSELQIFVFVCFHDGDPKYYFRLLSNTDCLYEGEVCSDEDMSSVVNEINDYVEKDYEAWVDKIVVNKINDYVRLKENNCEDKEVNMVPLNSVKFKGAEDGK